MGWHSAVVSSFAAFGASPDTPLRKDIYMSVNIAFGFIMGVVFTSLIGITEYISTIFYSKRAGFDCSKCKAWYCQGKVCRYRKCGLYE